MGAKHLTATCLAALGLLVTLADPGPALSADREHLLEWLVPPEPDVAGYKVYLWFVGDPTSAEAIDLGPHEPDGSGLASFPLGGLDPTASYEVAMTAYSLAAESELSNVITLAAICSHAGCDDGNPCTLNVCEPGGCSSTPLPDGSDCSLDGAAGSCSAGLCQPPPGCTSDTQCSDGDPCNGEERCAAGTCTPGDPLVCSSFDSCSVASCAAGVGCVEEPEPDGGVCDDGDPHSAGDRCVGGRCIGEYECVADSDCADADVCNGQERCETFQCVSGSPQDGLACDDGDPGTANDQCAAGACVGTVIVAEPDCSLAYGAPEEIVLTREGDPETSATVRWTAPAHPAGAALQLKWKKGGGTTLPGLAIETVDCSAHYEVRLENLTPGSRYSFRVSGEGADGPIWSKPTRFNTAGSTARR
jgi:hypothetical protein